jgi:hypothetical protein
MLSFSYIIPIITTSGCAWEKALLVASVPHKSLCDFDLMIGTLDDQLTSFVSWNSQMLQLSRQPTQRTLLETIPTIFQVFS